MMINNLILAHH